MKANINRLTHIYGQPTVIDGIIIFNAVNAPQDMKILSRGGENLVLLGSQPMQGRIVLDFRSSGSCIYLACSQPRISALIGHRCMLSVFSGTTFTNTAKFTLAEERDVLIGRDCMIAEEVVISNTDGHPIFDAAGNRINPSQDVVIDDGVWLGRGVEVLKGAYIGTGAIIGARALVAGRINERALAIGVPARETRQDIYFSRETTMHKKALLPPATSRIGPSLEENKRFLRENLSSVYRDVVF